jgi:hypothetical protein
MFTPASLPISSHHVISVPVMPACLRISSHHVISVPVTPACLRISPHRVASSSGLTCKFCMSHLTLRTLSGFFGRYSFRIRLWFLYIREFYVTFTPLFYLFRRWRLEEGEVARSSHTSDSPSASSPASTSPLTSFSMSISSSGPSSSNSSWSSAALYSLASPGWSRGELRRI